jgi:hypothetical protein
VNIEVAYPILPGKLTEVGEYKYFLLVISTEYLKNLISRMVRGRRQNFSSPYNQEAQVVRGTRFGGEELGFV